MDSGASTFGIRTTVVSFQPSGIIPESMTCKTSCVISSPKICQNFLNNMACKPSGPGALRSPILSIAFYTSSGLKGANSGLFICDVTLCCTFSRKAGSVSFIIFKEEKRRIKVTTTKVSRWLPRFV